MRKLEIPQYDPVDVFKKCISTFEDQVFKSNLEKCTKDIRVYSKLFKRNIKRNNLHKIKSSTDIRGIITNKEMKKVYEQKFVPKNSPGRKIYEELRNAPAHGICPLCGQRIVSTLDHYLSKMKYPALAVAPVNLVPSCIDCNKVKMVEQPTSSKEEFLHPYFDDVDKDEWLFADVIPSDPIIIKFYVKPPTIWEETLKERVKYHFEKLRLQELYSSHASVELANINHKMKKLYIRVGEIGLKESLLEELESRQHVYKNSWQIAFYRGLAESAWYCSKGVLQ